MARKNRSRKLKTDTSMAEAKSQQKISHAKSILSEQTLQEKNILPGLVVRFAYNRPKVYDRRPLVFVFQYDGTLIHGINMNYLHDARITKFAKLAQSLVPIEYENILKLRESYSRLQLSTGRRASGVDGKLLYKTVMPRDRYFMNAYRTYKLSSASSMKLVDYSWGIARKEGQSRGQRMSAEAIKKAMAGRVLKNKRGKS